MIAQQDRMDLYTASHGGQHSPSVEGFPIKHVPEEVPLDATADPETMNLVANEEEIMPLTLLPRAPSVVESEPYTVHSDAKREEKLPLVPRCSTRRQTFGRGRGRGRSHDF